MTASGNLSKRLLAVSGYDPTGGAGIQADIETAGACGIAISTLITCLAAQSLHKVHRIEAVSNEWLEIAVAALLNDLTFSGIKFGLLPSNQSIAFACSLCERLPHIPKVCDPVLIASTGDSLTHSTHSAATLHLLAPHLSLITPNRQELEALTGTGDLWRGVDRLHSLQIPWVLVTGTDDVATKKQNTGWIQHWLSGPDRYRQCFAMPRLAGSYHGSGCTLATAAAAQLALGQPAPQAIQRALQICWNSLTQALEVQKDLFLPVRCKIQA